MRLKHQLFILFAIVLTTFSFRSFAFEGPYVGGSFGGILSPVNHIGDKITDIVIAGGTGGASLKEQWQTARKPSMNLTFNAGYGKLFDKQYSGIEGSINKSRYRVKITKSRQDAVLDTHDELHLNLRDVDLSLDYRHGYLITDKTLLYGKVGVTRTRARLSLISDATIKYLNTSFAHSDFIKREKIIHPMRLGFGFEHKIVDGMALTFDYTYSRKLGSFKIKGDTTSTTAAGNVTARQNHKMTIQSTSIMWGLKKYF